MIVLDLGIAGMGVSELRFKCRLGRSEKERKRGREGGQAGDRKGYLYHLLH